MLRQLEPQGSKTLYLNPEQTCDHKLRVIGDIYLATEWGPNGDRNFFHLSQLTLGSTPHLSQVKSYLPCTILLYSSMSSIMPCKTTRAKTKVDKKDDTMPAELSDSVSAIVPKMHPKPQPMATAEVYAGAAPEFGKPPSSMLANTSEED